MVELIEANWILLVIALVIGVLVAWWVFVSSRRTKVETETQDGAAQDGAAQDGAAQDGAAGAPRSKRNQALIDAAPAAAAVSPASGPSATTLGSERAATAGDRVIPPAVPMGLAGAGEVVQAIAEPAPAPESRVIPEEKPASSPAPAPLPIPKTETAVDDIVPHRPDTEETMAEGTLPISADPTTPPPTVQGADAALAPTSDDLTRIKGLGPKIQVRLHELGVISFTQIADWDETEIDKIDAQLNRFQGRIRRDNWVEQARMLAVGDTIGYEQRFGKL